MNSDDKFEILFWKVFHNKYIFYNIHRHLHLYFLNRDVLETIYPQLLKEIPVDKLVIKNRYSEYIKSILISYSKVYIPYIRNLDEHIETVEYTSFGSIEEKLEIGDIPMTVKNLSLKFRYLELLESGVIPSTLLSLTLSDFNNPCFKFPITGLTYLDFGNCFNQDIIVNTLPVTLITLKVGNSFNHIINPNTLPNSILHLSFGSYDQEFQVNSLPLNLQSLVLSGKFNRQIESNQLPNTLSKLKFDSICYFNKPLDLSANENLKKLILNSKFKSSLKISKNLIKLDIDKSETLVGGGKLGINIANSSIKNLLISSSTQINSTISKSLPVNLERLSIKRQLTQTMVDAIPNFKSLTRLDIRIMEDQYDTMVLSDCINIKYLKFGSKFNCHLNQSHHFPPNLLSLEFGRGYNHNIVKNTLPTTLTSLKFGQNYTGKIDSSLFPPSLTAMSFGLYFTDVITKDTFPSTIKILQFEYQQDKSFEQFFPPHLKYLIFKYCTPIFTLPLPDSLETLFVPSTFDLMNALDNPNSSIPIFKVFSLSFEKIDKIYNKLINC